MCGAQMVTGTGEDRDVLRCVVSRCRSGFPRWVSRQVDTRSRASDHVLKHYPFRIMG